MTITRMTRADVLDAFGALGAFKPVGHAVLAFADDAAAARAAQALRSAGFAADDVLAFRSEELLPLLNRRLRDASGAAGFGYELTLMRRYIDLASQGAGWLVVYAPDDDATKRLRDVAVHQDARAGVLYHRLASEELVDPSAKRGPP